LIRLGLIFDFQPGKRCALGGFDLVDAPRLEFQKQTGGSYPRGDRTLDIAEV
jgi:hypothetical protein